MLVGACVTPTDPVLANSIINGRFGAEHVPHHLRVLLSAESGANDGAALPFLMFPMLILLGNGFFQTIKLWTLHVILFQILLSIVIGVIVGLAARKSLQNAEYFGLIDKESFLVFSIALAMTIMSLVTLFGSNDLLANFVAGVVFAWDDWFLEATKEAKIQEVVDFVFNLSFFVFLGTAIPWDLFKTLSIGRLMAAAILILLLRRLPIMMLLGKWIPELKSQKEAFFAGWFGPMGVGAIFYSCQVTIDWRNANILPIVWFIVLASIVAHGVTVPLFHLTMTRNITFSLPSSPILDPLYYNPFQHAPAPPSVGDDLQEMAREIHG